MHPIVEYALHQIRRQLLTGVSGTLGLVAPTVMANLILNLDEVTTKE